MDTEIIMTKDLLFKGKTAQWRWVHRVTTNQEMDPLVTKRQTFLVKDDMMFLEIPEFLHAYMTPLQCFILFELSLPLNKKRYQDLTQIYGVLIQTMKKFDSSTVRRLLERRHPTTKPTNNLNIWCSDDGTFVEKIARARLIKLTHPDDSCRLPLPESNPYLYQSLNPDQISQLQQLSQEGPRLKPISFKSWSKEGGGGESKEEESLDADDAGLARMLNALTVSKPLSSELRTDYDKILENCRVSDFGEYVQMKEEERMFVFFLTDIGLHDRLNPYIHKAAAICSLQKHTPPKLRPEVMEWKITISDDEDEEKSPFLLHIGKKSEEFPMMLYYLEGPLIDNIKATRISLSLIEQQVYWDDTHYTMGPVDF